EVLEWKLREHAEALEAYVRAIDEPSVSAEVIAAMDRCLASGHVSNDVRIAAIERLKEQLPTLPENTARAALELLLAQTRAHADENEVNEILQTMYARWPDDRFIAEHVSIQHLASGNWDKAEQARVPSSRAGIDAVRAAWRALDRGEKLSEEAYLTELPTGVLRAWIARELGVEEDYEGSEGRELLQLIQSSSISI